MCMIYLSLAKAKPGYRSDTKLSNSQTGHNSQTWLTLVIGDFIPEPVLTISVTD